MCLRLYGINCHTPGIRFRSRERWVHTLSCPRPLWRNQMEIFFALLALCAGNSPVTGEFPSQRPVTRSFDVFFDLRLYKRLSKHSWRRCFETPSLSLWRHCNTSLLYSIGYGGHLRTTVQFSEKTYLKSLHWKASKCDFRGNGHRIFISEWIKLKRKITFVIRCVKLPNDFIWLGLR